MIDSGSIDPTLESTPLAEYQEYVKRYGHSRADMMIETRYRHCKRLALVMDDPHDLDLHREQAKEVADFLSALGYKRRRGSWLRYLHSAVG